MNAFGYYKLGRRRNKQSLIAVRMRLVFFGFAGSTVTALHSLAEAMPEWIEVWGAEYPGRGMRWKETPLTCADTLIADLQPGLCMLDEMPLLLLGYSMGAHVAYRLALQTKLHHLSGLIALSARPPMHQFNQWDATSLNDTDLMARLDALGGMPKEVLSSEGILDNFLPVMRADLAVCADFNRRSVQVLPCKVLMLEGEDDRLLIDAEAKRWLEVAGGPSQDSMHRVYTGGHFFHKGREAPLAQDIACWISARRSQALPVSRKLSSNSCMPV